MSSETERNDPAGFSTALGLTVSDEPVADGNASFRARLAHAVGEGRGPRPDPTAPPPQRILAGVAVWAFVLALGGIVVGLASLVRIIAGAPWWFQPAIVLVGLLGMGLTVGGFATVQRKRTPWAMLAGATLTLLLGAALMVAA